MNALFNFTSNDRLTRMRQAQGEFLVSRAKAVALSRCLHNARVAYKVIT